LIIKGNKALVKLNGQLERAACENEKNDYVIAIDSENQTVTVNIDGNDITYDYSDLDELVLAYAVSIHKSQGSEYPAVIIPLTMAHYTMLQRNLLYTAITRGKKLVIVIGSKKALFLAVNNNKTMKRNTWLCPRLIKN
jgi:exodeoxyribonuclease V alpha subunit